MRIAVCSIGIIIVLAMTVGCSSQPSGGPAKGGASAPAPAAEIVDWKDVTVRPVTTKAEMPKIPRSLKGQGLYVKVRLSIVVQTDGSVSDVKVLSSTDERFTDIAVQSALARRYKPAEKDGRVVACRMETVEGFEID